MTAVKKQKWRNNRRSIASRPVQMTRHLIVCEGTETEPRYFEEMKAVLSTVNERKVSVVVRGSGKHTLDLFDYAEDLCRYAPESFDHVWLVFDKDDFPPADFDLVERRCCDASDSSKSFHALWSNPCFEIWLLLHLRYTTAPMDAAACQKALNDALKREYGVDYRKNMDGLFGLVDYKRDAALSNAAKQEKYHVSIGNEKPSMMNPGTRMADLFAEIGPYLTERFKSRDGRGDDS